VVGCVSRPGRPGAKGRPTPKRTAQGRRRALLWAIAKHPGDRRQWRGAVALFTLMVNRWSDDDAKAVFPSQVRMAAEMGCCDRQIRRYLDLLIGAGFLTVLAGKRHSQPDGTWYRSNNLYLFGFPKKRPAVTDRTLVSAHPPSERKNPPSQAAAGHPTVDVPADQHLADTPIPRDKGPIGEKYSPIVVAAISEIRARLRRPTNQMVPRVDSPPPGSLPTAPTG
jgi:hypothetical protein